MRLSANSNLIFENNYSRILLIHIKPENVIILNINIPYNTFIFNYIKFRLYLI